MKRKCPDCKVELDYDGEVKASESGESYEVRVLKCHKCGCEWNEEELE